MNKARRGTFLLLAAFAGILVLVGVLLKNRTETLLISYVESQTKKQAESFACIVSEELDTELEYLGYIASRIEENPDEIDSIMPLFNETSSDGAGIKQGLLTIDGEAIYGESLSVRDYEGIQRSFRGNNAICYVEDQGLLFTCPVHHDKNIRYVLYRLFPLEALEENFSISVYDNLGKLCVITRDGTMVIPFAEGNEEEISFIQSDEIINDFRSMHREMEVSVAAAHSFKTEFGDMILFESEIPGTDYLVAGFVPEKTASEGIDSLAFLMVWVFGLLMLLVLLSAFYLTSVSVKIRESDELREAKAVAEEASRAKSNFLANMSHEIRTPINAVLGFDELILRGTKEEETVKYATNIKHAGNVLLSLINDVLDFSKIEAGKMELVYSEYELASEIGDLSDMIAPRLRAKGIEFIVEVDSGLPKRLYGDPDRLKQCALNLLTNAVKYTEQGEVRLSVSGAEPPVKRSAGEGTEKEPASGSGRLSEHTDSGSGGMAASEESGRVYIRVSVKDTGIGIRQEDIDRLFSAFERIDETKNRTIEGTGLGLNIVKSLLEMMGSTLCVESEYGRGSEFSFVVMQEARGNEKIGDLREALESIEAESAYKKTFIAPKARLLLVDDTNMNLEVVKGLLKKTMVSIDTADSGKEALKLLSENSYDVLLFDHLMPEMNGVELLHTLKEDKENPNSLKPCIVMTANAVSGVREEYLKAGFDDYMSKPINGKALERLLVKYIPREKIELVDKDDKKADVRDSVRSEDRSLLEKLDGSGKLDVWQGIENNGTLENYISMLGLFCDTVKEKADEVLSLYDSGDIKDYTIKIHAMKSSL
ncbi:MAG: response regulator, partial [Lachnospiraceae bacterium]|nr:response regulator [Lachnospiraceae bacterium]